MSIKRRQDNITTVKKLLIIAIKIFRNFVVFFRRQSSRLNSAAGFCLGQSRDETLNGCHDRAERVDETIQFRRYKQQRSPHVTGSDETIEIETFVCRKHRGVREDERMRDEKLLYFGKYVVYILPSFDSLTEFLPFFCATTRRTSNLVCLIKSIFRHPQRVTPRAR